MSEQHNEVSPAIKKLQKLAKSKKYDELESEWMEAIETELANVEDLFSILDLLVRRKDAELAESLLYYLVSEQTDRLGADEALATVRRAAGLLPGSAMLREEAAGLYEKAHTSSPAITAMIAATVGSTDIPLPDAIEQIEMLLALPPGTYVLEEKSPGRVDRFDVESKELVVTFPDGEKSVDVASVSGLATIDPNDFRALALFDRERIQQLAAEDPGGLVVSVMRAFGRELSYRDIRERLKDVLGVSWAKWWAEAKLKIRRCPWLDVSEAAQPKFLLRREPVAAEDRSRDDFDAAKRLDEKLVVVLDYIAGSEAEDRGLFQHFADELASRLDESADTEPAAAVATLAVMDSLRRKAPEFAADATCSLSGCLSKIDEPSDVLRFTRNGKLAACVLGFIRASLPDSWHEVYATLLPGASQDACRTIAEEVSKGGGPEALEAAALAIMAQPDRNAEALAWLWKATCGGEYPDALGSVDRVAVLLSLLRVAHNLRRGTSAKVDQRGKDILSDVRSALSAKDYGLVRRVIEGSSGHRAKEIRDAAEHNLGLSEHAKTEIVHILQDAHADQFVETVAPWEEDAIYTTEEGLRKRREEHAHLVNVELAQAEKDIGKAAAFGDLSENSEYTAAIEQRDRLARKAGMMMEELSKARPITQEMVQADSVTVGTCVKARNLDTGAEESFTFLGPWDADLERGIYSYLAPLSLTFMGKAVGDTVSFSMNDNERKWEILEVSSAV